MNQPAKTIFKTKLTKNFTTLPNSLLRDKRLSYKARGLISMVLSNGDEWQLCRGWMESQSQKDGRDSVDAALKELRALGYVVLYQRNGKGGFRENVWEFHDSEGHEPPETGFPLPVTGDGKTAPGKTGGGKPVTSEETTSSKELSKEENEGDGGPKPKSLKKQLTDAWCEKYKEFHGVKYLFEGAKDGSAADRLLTTGESPGEIIALAVKAWSHPEWFNCRQASSLARFAAAFNAIRLELKNPPQTSQAPARQQRSVNGNY